MFVGCAVRGARDARFASTIYPSDTIYLRHDIFRCAKC